MRVRQISWRLAIACALGAEVVLVIAAFAWVALYSYLIHPGESSEFYRHYALGASPWVAVVVGIPVFYFAGRLIRARVPAGSVATAWCALGLYLLLEAPFVLGNHNPLMPAWLPFVGYAGKAVAIYLGARAAAASPPHNEG
jgi:hypothetical protein